MRLLSTKIFVSYLLVIILLTGLILLYSYQAIKTNYIETFADELIHINLGVKPQLMPLLEEGKNESLDSLVKFLGSETETRITLVDSIGRVLADSEEDPAVMENHATRPEILRAFAGETGRSIRYSTTVNAEMLYIAVPLMSGHTQLGVLRSSLFLSEINDFITQLNVEIIEVALIVVLISLFGVLLFSKNISRPINQLSQASRKVSTGDFDVKVHLRGHDEIKDLANSFNYMTEKIKDLFVKVTSQKDELNTLIGSIQEGLIVLDPTGRILLSNSGFDTIAGNRNSTGKYYWDVISEEDFSEIFKKVLNKKKSFTKELQIKGDFYLCSANYIESKKEIVLLLYNITELKKLELIKKDFVQNVSHELKTPLTAIKGFIETLEDEIEDKQNLHYISIIRRHTDRLILIVQDLLLLSELEDPNTKLLKSKTDIKYLAENVVKIFEQRLKGKSIELICEIQEHMTPVKVDAFRIEQVFINLIDNAIKYTDGGKIFVKIYESDHCITIEVRDSGAGMSREDQKRIFERFYTVDKSRSRKVGGTGLGLSIVKHIVQLHKGEISVESAPGMGTAFIIKLPIKSKKKSNEGVQSQSGRDEISGYDISQN
ncbi:MAG: ATP-binding protein [Candidatus Kapaibacterium sp.]